MEKCCTCSLQGASLLSPFHFSTAFASRNVSGRDCDSANFGPSLLLMKARPSKASEHGASGFVLLTLAPLVLFSWLLSCFLTRAGSLALALALYLCPLFVVFLCCIWSVWFYSTSFFTGAKSLSRQKQQRDPISIDPHLCPFPKRTCLGGIAPVTESRDDSIFLWLPRSILQRKGQ